MNKQEIEKAIECLNENYVPTEFYPEFKKICLDALTQQLNNGWRPVSESPSEYGTYMVAWRPINMTETDVKAKTRSQITHFYEILEYDPEDGAGWLETIEQSEGAYKILAWQPLPEPWEGDTE